MIPVHLVFSYGLGKAINWSYHDKETILFTVDSCCDTIIQF